MKKYSILFSELSKKTPCYEPDVYHFESIHEFLAFTKKTKFQEKMSCQYHYILSDKMDCMNKFRYSPIEEAKHYKQFKKRLKKYVS